nr:CARDB domain-containing protein [Halomicrobium zhouii]
MTMTAVVLIIVAGTGTIGDVNEDNKAEVAGQTFAQTDEAFQAFARQDRNRSRTVELPESMNGDVEVRDSSWRLRLNDNSDCYSGTRRMGEMRYEGDEQTVGYEGGGIWKKDESGATMDTPPELTYQEGSLSVRFPNITGEMTTSNRVSLSSNVSRQDLHNQRLSKALYTDLKYDETGSYSIVCSPAELDSATLWIEDSEYASAWARYFESNYEDELVSVETSDPIEPGDTVEVEFQLGDVSNPDYNITDYDVSRATGTSEMIVEAEITNDGGLDGSQDVKFDYTGPKTGSDKKNNVELESGESTTVSFSVPNGDIESTPPKYNLEVQTENDSRDVDIAFGSPTGTPDAAVDADVPQNASTREDATADVTVDNAGGMTAYEDVEFEYKAVSDSDWTSVGTKTVTVDPGSDGTIQFDLFTDSPGLYDWRAKVDGDTESGQYAVGSNPYFSIKETDGPAVVHSYNDYELDVTIENIGDLQGSMDVDVVIERNVSSGWSHVDTKRFPRTIDGTAYSSNEDDVTYRNTFTRQGEYRYTIETPNETTSETFHVGSPEKPMLVVDSVDIAPNPTTFDRYSRFDVTVENAGPETANQHVRVRNEDGEIVASEFVSVDPGESETIRQQGHITDSRFDIGHNSVTVTTANASVSKTLIVQERDNIGGGDDGTIVVNENVRAEIQVLGAELEGEDPFYDYGNHIIHAPTEMWMDIENDSYSDRVDLFEDEYEGDVNHPAAEKAMIENSSAYTVQRTFGAGTEISLFARSYYCGDKSGTGVIFEGIMPGGEDAEGLECSKDRERITISDDSNSQNVVILSDGDEVPAFGAADPYQRDLNDMLGHRIDDDGTLSLGADERVFLYELSDPNARPEDATGTDDPDYNDAVALFRVVDVQRTVQTPADFTIEDVDAPESVSRGEDAQISITVNNTGGTAGDTSVMFDMQDQDMIQGQTNELEPGETDTVTLDVPTDVDPDTYQYTVLLGSAPRESHYGAITIGEEDGPNFQITSMSAPNVNETHESPTVELEVTNTGNTAGSQDVRILEEPYNFGDEVDSVRVDLASHETKTVTLDLPTRGSSGEVYFKAATDDTTTREQRIYYGESDVSIESLAIGTSTYGSDGDLIERRNADTMSFKLENGGDVGGVRDVELVVGNDTDQQKFTEDSIQIGDGRIYSSYPRWLTFPVGLDTGYYDYSLTVEDHAGVEDTWEGELFISNEVDAGDGKNSSSPISVDSNEVVISG